MLEEAGIAALESRRSYDEDIRRHDLLDNPGGCTIEILHPMGVAERRPKINDVKYAIRASFSITDGIRDKFYQVLCLGWPRYIA
ncbi:hypothetical protein GCM10011385_39720 [Nitratireductor aestuarii]|uniref:Uncharacterized protein n=1 Tax=Nitratireductor aestuarii TaxID=1735103 RepID=A0A916S3E3_9HYPH|nr:hypothetical protein GCM10011385_39720 [Nitratireductor aestuarii]